MAELPNQTFREGNLVVQSEETDAYSSVKFRQTTLMDNIVITSLVGRYFKSGVSIKVCVCLLLPLDGSALTPGFRQSLIKGFVEHRKYRTECGTHQQLVASYLCIQYGQSVLTVRRMSLVINKIRSKYGPHLSLSTPLFINYVERIEIGLRPFVLHGPPEYTFRHADSSKVVQRRKLRTISMYRHKKLAETELGISLKEWLLRREEKKVRMFLDELTKVIPSFGLHFVLTKYETILLDLQSLNRSLKISGEAGLRNTRIPGLATQKLVDLEFKDGGEFLSQCLFNLFMSIWEKETVSYNWDESVTVPNFKGLRNTRIPGLATQKLVDLEFKDGGEFLSQCLFNLFMSIWEKETVSYNWDESAQRLTGLRGKSNRWDLSDRMTVTDNSLLQIRHQMRTDDVPSYRDEVLASQLRSSEKRSTDT
ncbi:hypothetical protein CLF_103156 [Clonorchis sinensis]|uniref:Uncharacterized protein n=1 Tax=Clonorchis sinensis TaxID=79923 RepID=G7Y963_CLOSI|nr:hypothetical protein CLF_103156 [Clonorchis sinensis]